MKLIRRRKQVTVAILLLAGLALLLTRRWWLDWLLKVFWPFVQEQSAALRGLKAVVDVSLIMLNGVLAYLFWLFRHEPEEREEVKLDPLRTLTPKDIRARLGRSGQVNWIDRHATTLADLHAHGRLVITGRMKLGKTREAAELIRRALAEDLVVQVYEPGPALRFLAAGGLRTIVEQSMEPVTPMLLFVDDLPYHFYGEGLERLGECLSALDMCKTAYVIATARSDQLTGQHQAWLERQGFHIIALPDLDAEQTGRLVDGGTGTFELQVSDAARAVFVAERDGTPELTLMGLRRLHADGVIQVDEAAAQQVTRESLGEAWAEARRYIVKRQPLAAYLLDSLATFHAAGVNAYTPLVLHYADRQWREQERGLRRPWLRGPGLRRALAYLAHFDVVAAEGEITYHDVMVEEVITPPTARGRLGHFLTRRRRLFQHSLLRRLHRHAALHVQALVELASQARDRGESSAAIHLYSAALRVRPHPYVYNNRGLAYAFKGEYDRAIEDFDQAIELQPDLAVAYNNRGNAYVNKEEYDRAIADFDQAIELQPDFAAAYYNRGNAYAGKGELDRAIADFDQAIELQPDYAEAYSNRGAAYYDKGEYDRAIEDYDQAIELQPDLAGAYSNRGSAYAHKGEYDRAIEDFDQAIELQPDYAQAYYNRGLAYAHKREYDRAIEDFDQAIALQPDLAEAYNNRGSAYAHKREYDRAIEDYSQAIALQPDLAVANYNRGAAYRSKGEYNKAIEDFRKVVEVSDNPAVRQSAEEQLRELGASP